MATTKSKPAPAQDMAALGRKGGLKIKRKRGKKYFAELQKLRSPRCNVCHTLVEGAQSGGPCLVPFCTGTLRMPGGRPPGSKNVKKKKK